MAGIVDLLAQGGVKPQDRLWLPLILDLAFPGLSKPIPDLHPLTPTELVMV